jgi:hypothetical protein
MLLWRSYNCLTSSALDSGPSVAQGDGTCAGDDGLDIRDDGHGGSEDCRTKLSDEFFCGLSLRSKFMRFDLDRFTA